MKKQFGRSMIEMLGVLAIIGVISIGGISLYRRAVDTNKANNIFDDVNRFEFVISERVFRTPRGFIDKADFKPISGFDMTAYNELELSSHHISILSVPKSVCRIVLEKGEGKYVMYVKTHLYEGDTSICSNTNEMRFYFGDTSDLTCSFPDKDAGEIGCSDGCLCPKEENECKPDIYKQNYPNPSPILENTVCCPKDSNIEACHNQCVDGTCSGENMFFNPKECKCTCTDPDNMIYDPDQNKCTCGTDSNGTQLVLKNGKCICPSAGFTLVDGICSKFDCRNGTTGNTFACYISDYNCGANCDSTGHNCERGICHAEDCGSYEFVELAKDPGYPNNYHENFYDYRCKRKEGNFSCYTEYRALSSWRCYNEDGANCMSISGTTYKGICDKNECAIFKDSEGIGATLIAKYGLCRFEADDYECYRNGTKWNCFKNFNSCGVSCTDPSNCSTCKSQIPCNNGWTWNETSKRCENSSSYCVPYVLYSDGYSQYCYSKSDNTKCATYVRNFTNNLWGSGDCSDQNCSSYKYNGQTMTFGAVTSEKWGCVAGKMGCYTEGTKVICYYDGELCGTGCNYLGQNCQRVLLPQCAVAGHCPQTGYDMTVNPCTCDGAVTSNVSVTVEDGNGGTTTEKHSFCCPTGHTYVNGGCAM